MNNYCVLILIYFTPYIDNNYVLESIKGIKQPALTSL